MVKIIKNYQREFRWTPQGPVRNRNYKDTSNKNLCVLNKKINSGQFLSTIQKKEDRERHGGYKHLIYSKNMNSQIAFYTDRGLKNWMNDRGLKKGEKGWGNSSWNLKGKYEEVSLAGNKYLLDKFGKSKKLKPIAVLNNGGYTRGYVKKDKNKAIIYYLNPNYDRIKLKYRHP